jgi:uncharacterized membrane protein YbhN (UPF0104 family)
MIAISDKAKQFGVFIIKLLIVIAAFYFIYIQLAENKSLNWTNFITLIKEKSTFLGILFILSFSVANRFLEILKWQNLVSFIKPISVFEATKQVLGALTAGIFTPNGLGEYAGKALYFKKTETKTVVFLNLICNGIQMILTVIFGTIGLLIIGYWKWALALIGTTIFIFIFSFISKKITIKGYSIEKLIEKINEIPKSIHQKNNFLGIARYLIFSHQTYFLFLAFDVNLPYITIMATIAVVYLLSSIMPSFQFLDFAVKGSIAVFFYKNLGVNEWIVVFITTLTWFLNVVLPVLIGSYFVLIFKAPKSLKI